MPKTTAKYSPLLKRLKERIKVEQERKNITGIPKKVLGTQKQPVVQYRGGLYFKIYGNWFTESDLANRHTPQHYEDYVQLKKWWKKKVKKKELEKIKLENYKKQEMIKAREYRKKIEAIKNRGK